MARIIKADDGVVSCRLDNVYTVNEKHFLEPYVNDEDKKSYFGSFKFINPKEAKKVLKDAVRKSDWDDTVFDGQYPRWIEDEYGTSLNVNNRVKFYRKMGSSDLVPNDDVRDYIYSIEVHLKKSKDDGIFLVVARAIVSGRNENQYNDDLFDDFVGDFEGDRDEEPPPPKKDDTPTIDITEDDLPF